MCTICAENTEGAEDVSHELRVALRTERNKQQDKWQESRFKSGAHQVATTCIAFVLFMAALIIPAYVCAMIFVFFLPLTVIGWFNVWYP